MTTGWIYVLRCEPLSIYKIGKTSSLDLRIKTLRIQLPFPVSVFVIIPTPDIDWMEREFHSDFAAQRKNGEWFALLPEQLEELETVAAIGFSGAPDWMMQEASDLLKIIDPARSIQ
jgi:hypothetical protein